VAPGSGADAVRLIVPPEHAGERLDKVISRLLPDTSRATVQRWIAESRVRVNGQSCRARDHVQAGSVIEVEPGPQPASDAQPDAGVVFGVLYEDAHLIVVDKPAGLVVHPARGHAGGTLVNGLLARPGFVRPPGDPLDPQAALRPGIVHRLDKDTSGVLVIAKDSPTREGLKQQLSVHSVERVYLALTSGVPQSTALRTQHARHPRSRLRFTSRTERGRPAVTHVRTVEVLARGRAALVECRLETGRTHQIRVHLSERTATPLLADALYGKPVAEPEVRAIADQLGRQALHASVLGFRHPVTGEPMRFVAELPDDFRSALESLRKIR
jgi:23S rRNA pseudouridine1911/1915/1917 synthase